MTGITYVGIAEYKIGPGEGVLACSALGSCVGVCLWDCGTRLSGLLHVLLPSSKDSLDQTNPYKFADPGIARLVGEMERRGASRGRLRAKLAGGACLYRYERACLAAEIGQRNIEAARAALQALRIPLLAEHVGGEFGRSIYFDEESFAVRVQVLAREAVVI